MIGRRTAPDEQIVEEPKGFDDYDVSLGDVMRGERATLGKSLLDVQRELKIKATYIAAIENCDPTVFETPGFIAGYVRSYARYLGLDAEWAFAAFCREGDFTVVHGMSAAASGAKPAKADKRRATPGKDIFEAPTTPFVPRVESLFSKIEPGALGSTAVLLALIGFIGYGGWAVLQEVQRVQFTPVDQTPGVASNVDSLSADNSLASADNSGALGLDRPSDAALDRLYRPQALDVPVLTARDGPIASLDPGPSGAPATTTRPVPDRQPVALAQATPARLPSIGGDRLGTPIGQPVAQPDDTGQVRVVADNAAEVVMFAVRPSWVRVKAADGTVLFEKILDAGETYVLPRTEEPPTLRAGNAGSVYFSVNGQTYGPSGSGPSVVKNVSLGAAQLTQTYALADPQKDGDLARIVAMVGNGQ